MSTLKYFCFCRYPANSNPTFSTFRQQQHGSEAHSRQQTSSRQCYATRHGDRQRRQEAKLEPNGYRSDGGYKSDGYKSDGEGYKSDRDGYKSDGGGYRSDGERIKQRRNRYNSPNRKPTKYEIDRLAGRRLQPNGDQKYVGAGACCIERTTSRAGDIGISRSSSRGDPEHEIEIQLQCLGSQDDSGGSQHSHRGCSLEDEDEIIVVEEQMQRAPDIYRPSDSGESRAHSRNGYKSDGSHGSTQESPLHLKPLQHHNTGNNPKRRIYGHHHNLNNHPGSQPGGSYSSTHLNAQYMQPHPHQPHHPPHPHQRHPQLHPNKHLEASRSFHTFQRQESTTSFHSTHSAPSQHHPVSHNLMVNNIESASQASTHSHSSSSSASVGPPDYQSLHPVHHPPPSYDQALIKLDIAMRRRAQTKRVQQKGAYNSLHYVGEFYG